MLLAIACAPCIAADLTMLSTATNFYQSGQLDKALPLLEETLLAIDTGEFSKRHLNQCLKPLTDIYRRQGDYEKALVVARRYRKSIQSLMALDARRRALLLRDNTIELADIYTSLGRHSQAEPLWQVAVKGLPDEVTKEPRLRLLVYVKLAKAAEQQGKIALAKRRWRAVTEVAEPLLVAIDADQLDDSLVPEVATVLSAGYAATERIDEAISAQRRLLKYTIQGKDLVGAVRGCAELGKLFGRQREFDKARNYLQKGLSLVAKIDERYMSEATLQQALASINKSEGREVEAKEYALAAAMNLEKLLASGKRSSDTERMVLYGQLQDAYQLLSRYHDAIRIGRSLIDLRTKQLGKDHPLTVDARGRLGAFYGLAGNYGQALPLIDSARKYWQTREPPDPIRVAHLINDLAVIQRATGSFDRAEALMAHALALREEHLAADDLMLAYSHANLASVLSPQGHYAQAIMHYQQAVDIMRRKGDAARGAISSTLLNMAMTYKSQGQLERAAEYCQRSLREFERQFGTRALGSVAHHNALAALSIGRGNLVEALGHNDTALSIGDQHEMGKEPVYATALHHRATIAYVNDDLETARQEWVKALEIQSAAGDVMQQTRSLVYLAKVTSLQDDNEQAEQLYRRAVELSDDSNAYPTLQYLALCNLAQLLDARGETNEARQLLIQAIELLETPRAGTVGAEVERAATFSQFVGAFDLLVKWSLRDGLTDEAIRWAERARNRTFLDQMRLAGVDLRLTLDPQVHKQLLDDEERIRSKIGSLRTEVYHLVRAKAGANKVAEMAQDLDMAQKQYSEIRTNIRSLSGVYREHLAAGVELTVSDMRDWLAQTSQLMLFYILGTDQSHLLILGDPNTDAHVFPLELTVTAAADAKMETRSLTRQATIGLVSQLMEDLNKREGGRGLGQVVYAKKGVRKGQEVVQLAEILLPSRARQVVSRLQPSGVVIVPDGALHQLPFEALLLTSEPTKRYVFDLFPAISYAPSAAILMNLVDRSTANVQSITSVLTVGNPLYAQSSPASETQGVDTITRAGFLALGGELSLLPGTAEESDRVAQSLKRLTVEQFGGSEATERNVRQNIANKQFVHLAAHGLVDEQYDNCYGAIALAPPEKSTNESEDDGFLELREIQTLPLSECELAVLSACQTVVGPNRPHEAGSSLSQAFLIAGARRVVCSHWNVDDASTAEMMGSFFEKVADALAAQQSPNYADALKTAREQIRHDQRWSAPYYWAPFVLIGPAR